MPIQPASFPVPQQTPHTVATPTIRELCLACGKAVRLPGCTLAAWDKLKGRPGVPEAEPRRSSSETPRQYLLGLYRKYKEGMEQAVLESKSAL
jgi:hypothetical protein